MRCTEVCCEVASEEAPCAADMQETSMAETP